MGGCREEKAGLRIAYNNQKSVVQEEWVGGWRGVKAVLRIAYINQKVWWIG